MPVRAVYIVLAGIPRRREHIAQPERKAENEYDGDNVAFVQPAPAEEHDSHRRHDTAEDYRAVTQPVRADERKKRACRAKQKKQCIAVTVKDIRGFFVHCFLPPFLFDFNTAMRGFQVK